MSLFTMRKKKKKKTKKFAIAFFTPKNIKLKYYQIAI